MRKTVLIIPILVLSICMVGCGKKQPESAEKSQEPMSIEALSTLGTNATEVSGPGIQVNQNATVSQVKLESLPPSGPYRPTVLEIQTALKNAGYYADTIDGKTGPKTKKAIEDFQKANGLQADGKVGPKTWSVLSAHLNPAPVVPETPAGSKAKKR